MTDQPRYWFRISGRELISRPYADNRRARKAAQNFAYFHCAEVAYGRVDESAPMRMGKQLGRVPKPTSWSGRGRAEATKIWFIDSQPKP